MSLKRKCLTLEDKVKVIQSVDKGSARRDAGIPFGITENSVKTILKNREKILSAYEKWARHTKKVRSAEREDVDACLLKWFTIQRGAGVPITGHILLEKANQLAKISKPSENFVCNEGWIQRFKRRHNLTMGTISGEAGAVSLKTTSDWMKTEWPKLCSGYAQEDVFNADETGLFYKMLPNKTIKFKGERCEGGKISKQRMTVLLCANMAGTEKRKLVVVGRFQKPRCFKGLTKMPVKYHSNTKSWMTAAIFAEEVKKWDAELGVKNRRILLVVDNCTAHPRLENLKNITLAFFPANTTSVLQPLDQGVIRSFKAHYRKLLLLDLITAMDRKEEFVVTVADAITYSVKAWKRVSGATIRNCFRKAQLSDCKNFEDEVSSI